MAAIDTIGSDGDLACMSVTKLAELLECSRQQAYNILRRLPPGSVVRIGDRGLRVRIAAVKRFMASGGIETA